MSTRKTLLALLCAAMALFVAPMRADDNTPQAFYAFMNNAASWLDCAEPEPYYGFYSFRADGEGGFTAISPVGYDTVWALTTDGGGAGTYDEGVYYCYSASGLYTSYRLSFYKVDTKTWRTTYSTSFQGTSANPVYLPVDMATNPVDGTIYATCRPRWSNSDYGVLCTVNTETGALTKVAQKSFYRAIACDAKGNLYALDNSARLLKVNISGDDTVIGSTGLHFTDFDQTATIDARSGKMYLSLFGRPSLPDGGPDYNASIKGLYEIDLTTARATRLHEYGDYEELSALSTMNARPEAPDYITDLVFTAPLSSSLDGSVSLTVPSKRVDQAPLQGNVTISLYLDNEPAGTFTKQPGARIETPMSVTEPGWHTLTAVATAAGRDGVQATARAYFGMDAPDKVSNLKLTPSSDLMTATLTWDAPTGSVNGGAFDPEKVRYTIVRYPGAETVARACKETTFTETVPHEYCRTYYTVTPYIDGDTGKRGSTVKSDKIFMGKAWELPLTEMFNGEASLDPYTIIDANGDGGDWEWESPVWKYDPVYACAFFYHSFREGPADDWLVTPKLDLKSDMLYRIVFQHWGYYGGRQHRLRVLVGTSATVDGMTKLLYDETDPSITDNKTTTELFFAPQEGGQFIGFHNLSTDNQHVSIDNILVEEVGSALVPDKVTDIKTAATDRVNHKLSLSFKAPTTDAAGRDLKENISVAIYRGSDADPVKTFDNVKPGTSLQWIDENAAPALNVYTIVPSNSAGRGIETTTSFNMSAGVPNAPLSVLATLVSSTQAVITWTPNQAAFDADGNEIDLSTVRYTVYRPGDTAEDFEILARGLSECTFVDEAPLGGGDSQVATLYYVAAVNGDGESYVTASNPIYVGPSYRLPFSETWYGGGPSTSPWLQGLNGTATWMPAPAGYSPSTQGQDGMGLMSLDINSGHDQGQASYWSPRIDLSDVQDATLSFYLYGENTYSVNDRIYVGVDIDGQGLELIPGATFTPRSWSGWKKCEVSLKSYVGNERVSVVFDGNITAKGDEHRIHLDNLSITGVKAPHEVKVSSISGPTQVRSGKTYTYTVKVENTGTSDCNEMPLVLLVDDREMTRANVPALAAGDNRLIEVQLTVPDDCDDVAQLTAEIYPSASYDSVETNNRASMTIVVKPLNLPHVTDLNGVYEEQGSKIKLEWSNPSEADFTETVTDGAEYYDAFAIDGFGCWTLRDGDKLLPFKFKDPTSGVLLEWENNDQLQSWMVFRPDEVTADKTFSPNAGRQNFISWACAGAPNDDWLISPRLDGNSQLLSFYVRRLNERDAVEKYNVLYSTTDASAASFLRLNGDEPLLAPADWTLKYFNLPQGTRYFAIQYVGYHQSAIMLDDIQYEGYPTHVRPDGYNIYRDGERINASPIGRKSFTDSGIAPGKHTYCVRAIYDGIEAPEGNKFTFDTTSIAAAGAEGVQVTTIPGYIVISGAQGLDASIFAVDGKQLAAMRVNAPSQALAMPAGIYIVRIGTYSYKLIVR